jgi:pimeloyl-ACP methyl ester carboxylesterase
MMGCSLALCVILLLAAWAHYAFWSRRYSLPTGEDEVVPAVTADGWRLGLARRRPRGPPRGPPVLLVHGLAANRVSMDFCIVRWSLSAYLAAAGFDCFALDLRGHGLSRRAPHGARRRWTFDDHVRLDVPAALDAVRAATGESRVLWVGHSQGGLIGIAAAAAHPQRVAALVALGAPAFFDVQGIWRLFVRFGFLFTGKLNRFFARSLAPFAGYWHPPVSEIAINTRNVLPEVYRRVLVNVVENVSSGVLRQLGRWILTDTFGSMDRTVDYRAGMATCRQPALFVAAAADRLAPPALVERAAQAWGGEATLIRVGIATAARADYGHSDLLFGRGAPEDVFAPVRTWLARHAVEQGAAGGAPGEPSAPAGRGGSA